MIYIVHIFKARLELIISIFVSLLLFLFGYVFHVL